MKYAHALKQWDGNASAMARDMGLPVSTVLTWKVHGIPPLRQLHIERLTNGAVKADADVFAPARAA